MDKNNRIKIMIGRLTMLITALIIFMFLTYVWLIDSSDELLEEFIEVPIPDELLNWQILSGYVLNLLPVIAMLYGFYWIHKLFQNYQANNDPSVPLALTVKHFGLSQIYFWVSLLVVDTLTPLIILYHSDDLDDFFEIALPLDPSNIFLVNGIVLLIIAKLIVRASQVHEENQEFV